MPWTRYGIRSRSGHTSNSKGRSELVTGIRGAETWYYEGVSGKPYIRLENGVVRDLVGRHQDLWR